MMSNHHHHQLWKSSNEHSSHENIYTIPESINRPLSWSMYQTSLLLKKTRVWNSEPLENALRPLRNPVQMVWSLSVVPAKFSGLGCASSYFFSSGEEVHLLPSNWNSVFRSTCLNKNHWAWTHHHVMIWIIGFSHMALLKVGGHFTVLGFRVCSILYVSCLYILICVVTKLETSKSMQDTNPWSLKPYTQERPSFFSPLFVQVLLLLWGVMTVSAASSSHVTTVPHFVQSLFSPVQLFCSKWVRVLSMNWHKPMNPWSLKPYTGKDSAYFCPCLCRFFCCFEVWWCSQLLSPSNVKLAPHFLTESSLQC